MLPETRIGFHYAGSSRAMAESIDDLISKGRTFGYYNHSMTLGGDISKDALLKLSYNGATIVSSAGNEGQEVVDGKNQLSKRNHLILVGSLNPALGPSTFTSFGEEVVISAPSDDYILSTSDSGELYHFGGTSGAAPLVTGSLASFEIATGHFLGTENSKKLLKKTAIATPFLKGDKQIFGAGMLNSYKIFKVAQRINEKCPVSLNDELVNRRSDCVRRELEGNEIYEFPMKDLSEEYSLFPECQNDVSIFRSPTPVSA